MNAHVPFVPRWYQNEAVDSIWQYYANPANQGLDERTNKPKKKNPLIVMPTGSGKSGVIGELMRRTLWAAPRQRFLVATHVKELIRQNADDLEQIWPAAPYGIHSDGLKQRDHAQPIIFGGVASMWKTPDLFGHRDALIVDEAHLINFKADTMYHDLISGLLRINPWMRVIGLTATDYRSGLGKLTDDGGLFTDVSYNLATIEGFARLIAEGHMAPLFPRPTQTKLDVTGVKTGADGDYNEGQLQKAVDKAEITHAALTEALHYGHDRRSWICFASGIEHAEHIAEWLNAHGIVAAAVHSKNGHKKGPKGGDYNDEAYEAFKAGHIRCLVGNNKFTTGFNHKPVDFIIMLRPTKSTSLWVQMLGRGTRPYPGKYYCLVLDFADNAPKLGPINDPVLPRKKGQGTGEAPIKICQHCGVYNHTSARHCIACGEEFLFIPKIKQEAGTTELLRGSSTVPKINRYEVEWVRYFKHQSQAKPLPSMLVQYQLKGRKTPFNEYVNFEHEKARHFAKDWWMERSAITPPITVDEALKLTETLRVPLFVEIHVNAEFPKIVRTEYGS